MISQLLLKIANGEDIKVLYEVTWRGTRIVYSDDYPVVENKSEVNVMEY